MTAHALAEARATAIADEALAHLCATLEAPAWCASHPEVAAAVAAFDGSCVQEDAFWYAVREAARYDEITYPG